MQRIRTRKRVSFIIVVGPNDDNKYQNLFFLYFRDKKNYKNKNF